MPSRSRNNGGSNRREERAENEGPSVRSFWSGTITFGLVSIPVDLFSATRARQTAMKMVDKDGHPLGRQYHCSKEGKKLRQDDLVRGFETEAGEIVVITDEEFEAVAPEMSRDIELRSFVPFDEIPPLYYERPYFLAPAGRSAKAYHLLAKTMERTGRVAIGSFVMRGQEHLIAILSDNGVLRAETLRYFDEVRSAETVGLPKRAKAPAKKVQQIMRDIDSLTRKELDVSELEDREADALQELAASKQKEGEDVIEQRGLEEEDAEGGSAEIIDLMEVLRNSLSKKAVVTTASNAHPPTQRARPKRANARHGRTDARASAARAPKRNARDKDELSQSSKEDLYKMAADLHIPGRSKMGKRELVNAIRRAG